MFILDSLMIAGIKWVLDTTRTAAEAEMNDDTALRERLLEVEMRREAGEISDGEFRVVEADLLARIREIRERRDGPGPLAFGAGPIEASPASTFQVEAELSGDFHEADANRSDRSDRSDRSSRSSRSSRSAGATGTAGTPRTPRTPRSVRATRTTPPPRTPRAIRSTRTTKA